MLRDNDLVELPKELGKLAQLKELHLQNNRLTALPPELGKYVHVLSEVGKYCIVEPGDSNYICTLLYSYCLLLLKELCRILAVFGSNLKLY